MRYDKTSRREEEGRQSFNYLCKKTGSGRRKERTDRERVCILAVLLLNVNNGQCNACLNSAYRSNGVSMQSLLSQILSPSLE